jgi:hypothetical protein
VVDKYEYPAPPANAEVGIYFPEDAKEGLHMGYGGGLHIAINENFVVAADFARAVKKDDGKLGVYIGLNFLF